MAYRRTSHAVYELNYHFVWPPKYRKHIGTTEVKKFLEDLFPKVATAYRFEVIEQNVQPDYIHLFIQAPPRFAPAHIVETMKSISVKEVFKKFPRIRDQLWGGELWSSGYFVRAVGGQVTSFVIQRYIRYQNDTHHGKKQSKLF